MRNYMWIAIMGLVIILSVSSVAFFYVRAEVPAQLAGKPLLALKDYSRSLKDIIFETQKQVVMIETAAGNQGSGFLYNSKGDLITNAHVVSGARNVSVKTADARELVGEVIGISTTTDIAVVRVPELVGMEPLSLVRHIKAEVGDNVLAVGSPLGFQNTITTGMISGIGRNFEIGRYQYTDLYQISAPIAQGNSGGPLVDQKTGEVIGINSAGTEEGTFGFSIPITNVISMVEEWSETPMEMLPDLSIASDDELQQEATSLASLAEYLVTHFYDSLNNSDYVYAYSLLGGTWREGTNYDKFRSGYLDTRNVVIDDIHVSVEESDEAVVTAVLSVDERKSGDYVLSKYQVTYKVGYENDQLKILTGKGKLITGAD
ncbi:S1C family serine protease [Paenibacillus yanchengensis]|uniref:S1C family serine protease n=1 Tax=Paenibacillus yanchengensis TaxID=2035833 RepID=A0ABW4YIE6_9BACL